MTMPLAMIALFMAAPAASVPAPQPSTSPILGRWTLDTGSMTIPADARPERYGVWDHVPPGWWAQMKDPFRDRTKRPTLPRGSFDGLPAPF